MPARSCLLPLRGLLGLLGASLGLALAFACAPSPDPARISNPDPRVDGGSGGTPSSSSGGGGSGEIPPLGNGDPTDPLAADVVYDSEIDFSEGTNSAHAAIGDAGAAPTAQANPDCLACHGEGKSGAQTKYLTGGLVFQTVSGDAGTPCAGCEVLFVDQTSRRVKILTGADGTFAVSAAEFGSVGSSLRVGIRKGELTAPMPGDESINGANGAVLGCNNASCHQTGAEGPISFGSN